MLGIKSQLSMLMSERSAYFDDSKSVRDLAIKLSASGRGWASCVHVMAGHFTHIDRSESLSGCFVMPSKSLLGYMTGL
jgi:hypothetical protein